jgi:hypothetical protein
MITLLYRDCLVLASAEKAAQVYTVQAIIGLSDVRVEEIDNGRGMLFLLIRFFNIKYLPEWALTSFRKLVLLPVGHCPRDIVYTDQVRTSMPNCSIFVEAYL